MREGSPPSRRRAWELLTCLDTGADRPAPSTVDASSHLITRQNLTFKLFFDSGTRGRPDKGPRACYIVYGEDVASGASSSEAPEVTMGKEKAPERHVPAQKIQKMLLPAA